MLKGFLAGTAFYACTAHSDKIIEEYENYLEPIFKKIKECEGSRDVNMLLESDVCHNGFKRLN